MNGDPEQVTKKLEDIHQDVREIKTGVAGIQGEFKTAHDRMDREIKDRGWSWVGVIDAIRSLEQRLIDKFRSKGDPP